MTPDGGAVMQMRRSKRSSRAAYSVSTNPAAVRHQGVALAAAARVGRWRHHRSAQRESAFGVKKDFARDRRARDVARATCGPGMIGAARRRPCGGH